MNKRILLSKRPVGMPAEDTWTLDIQPIPEVPNGYFLVKNEYVSLDPAMRGWINDMKSYIPPVQIGEVMRAGSIGKVVESKHSEFKVGDVVSSWGGVQQYNLSNGNDKSYKVDTSLAPMPVYIGTLGMPGMTAYFGILQEGKIKEGDKVLVSGGAGAVGSIVGQIAKIKGCTVIGIAGGPEKCKYMKETLGFDGVIDYKNEDINIGIKREMPDGIDVYFDNVGGEILDAALARLRMNARIVICGAISQYNHREAVKGPSNYLSLLVNRASMIGMVVLDYAENYDTAAKEMGMWMSQGKLISREDIYDGIENFYDTFKRLFTGEKMGKLILKVDEN